MPRSLGLTAESPASVEQFHAAFSNEDYWQARLAFNDSGAARLDTLTVDANGAVNVVMTFTPLHDWLPGPIARFRHGEVEILHREMWCPVGDGQLQGRISFEVSGLPLSGFGALLLTPMHYGSELKGIATVEVKVPLVGGTIERFIGGQLPDGILVAERFTTEWITTHG